MPRIRRPKGQRIHTCTKCGCELEEHRKGKYYCLPCNREYMRIHRPRLHKISLNERKKGSARAYLNYYIKIGKVSRKPCEVCGNEHVWALHEDYNYPLNARWFCPIHHMEFRKNRI